MQRRSQPVEVAGIDTQHLERDGAFSDAYAFYIKLSSEPDDIWLGHLAKWDSALRSMKREISVEKDRLRVVFVYGDNVQRCVDYVTQLITWVNGRVAEHNESIALKEKEGLRKQDRERRKEDHILQELKQVSSVPSIASTEVAIKDLASAYENNSVAYERYRNNILKIRGLIKLINTKHDYIVLTDALESPRSVSCSFDKEHSQELKSLKNGQGVTVTGEFEGSAVQLSMRHCTLVT